MTRTLLFATLAVACAVHSAHADAPAWCNQPDIRGLSVPGTSRAYGDDVVDALRDLVAVTCDVRSPDFERQRVELETVRARWNKRLSMTDADWADVAVWAIAKNKGAIPDIHYDRDKAWSALGPLEQYSWLSRYGGEYEADALADKLTEAGRLGYIVTCLRSKRRATWAACQPDIEAFDPAKLSKEIAADTSHTGVDRMQLRLAAYQLPEDIRVHRDAITRASMKERELYTMFATAKATRSAWAPDPNLVAIALAMDDARVAGAKPADCEATTAPGFTTAVTSVPAKKFGDLKADSADLLATAVALILGTPDGYLGATAYAMCRAGSSNDELVGAILGASVHWFGYRGPRTAALSTMLAAADKKQMKLFPSLMRKEFGVRGGSGGGARDRVAAVKPAGKQVGIEYVKKLHQEEQCADWKDTDRIIGITPAGTVMYDYVCLKYESVTVNGGLAPRTVSSIYAAGVKPGAFVATYGAVVVSVATKANAAPSYVFGIAVK